MHCFNGEDLDRLIGWLIDNTYVVNGSVCRRQTVGLPMGTNCAPALCNLGLFTWEFCYIERLVSRGDIEKARAHHMTFRLIDDVLTVNNPFRADFFQLLPGLPDLE